MTVPQNHIVLFASVRRIRTFVGFGPIEAPKSTGTAMAVPYISFSNLIYIPHH